jgi:serine/threonine protein kinase/tetratricopeptide (TPR) repeat protein
MEFLLSPNTAISHYRILNQLGAGGMGEVYLAEDHRLGRKIALKILPREFTLQPERLARFIQEARSVSALNHPNIVTIHEIGQEADLHYIAFEYVEGRTLRQCLNLSRLEIAESVEIATQIAVALQAAHELGITHRDIKPENVMLRNDGYVKVLDFGLAKPMKLQVKEEYAIEVSDLPPAVRNPQLTNPGVLMGTVAYMSPEQARGYEVDARSDVFSLGILLYELIAGRPPFDGETSSDVIAAILTAHPIPVSQRVPELPVELSHIIDKCLRKEREDRYPSMRGFLDDLRRIRQRLGIRSENEGIRIPGDPLLLGSGISDAPTIEFSSAYSLIETRALSSGHQIDSLAIMPFANDSADAGMEYLSDGITESIINSLLQLPQLRVVPRSTVFRYKGTDIDPYQVAAILNVRAVLAGRILLIGNTLVVKTELIDALRASQLWGEQYRRQLTDIFDLTEDISREISDALRLKLSGEERMRLMKRYTDNTAAYHLYLKGRHYVHKRTPDWIKKGIENFSEAIDLDPNYALAYAGLAEAHGFMASSTGGQPPREAYPKAYAAASRALELDDSLGEAHCTLGFYYLLYEWNFAAAGQEFQKSIELSPNFSNAWDGYGFYLKANGRHEDAIRACTRAQELDPLSMFTTLSLGWAYYFSRQWSLALEQSRKVLDMDPNFGFAYWHRGLLRIQQRNYDEAIADFRKAINLSGANPTFISYLGHAQARAGKHREARQMLSQLDSLQKRRYVSSYFFAMIYLGLDDRDSTFARLEQAWQERAGFLAFLNVEPILDPLRNSPEFARLVEKCGLPE